MAIPRSPISASVHTGIVTSVVVLPAAKSLSAASAAPPNPPFSATSSRPSGRKAIAVGLESPVTYGVSVKPGAGVPARAETHAPATSMAARSIRMGRTSTAADVAGARGFSPSARRVYGRGHGGAHGQLRDPRHARRGRRGGGHPSPHRPRRARGTVAVLPQSPARERAPARGRPHGHA